MKLSPSALVATVFSTSLPATRGLQTDLDAIAVGINNAVPSSYDISSRVADKRAVPQRRLFTRAPKVDAGILGSPLFSRNLQAQLTGNSTDTNANATSNGNKNATTSNIASSGSNCPSTCPENLCTCAATFGYAEACLEELHPVCAASTVDADGNPITIDSCIANAKYVSYYENVYCPFVECRVEGGTYAKCQCDSYVTFCNIYKSKEGYENDNRTLEYCSVGTCCSAASDDVARLLCLDPVSDSSAVTETSSGSSTMTMKAFATTSGAAIGGMMAFFG